MGALASVLYGGIVYLFFLATFLYAVAFVGNLPVPKTIDSGMASPWPLALAVNTALLGLFAVQHSVMARPAFKRWWTRLVPEPVERTTYVLFASLALLCSTGSGDRWSSRCGRSLARPASWSCRRFSGSAGRWC